jgi:SAM-dependent methyltransferase
MKQLTNSDYWEESVWKGQRPRRLLLYRDYDAELVRLLLQLAPRPAGQVLEVGAGGSLILPYLARRTGCHATGTDYSLAGCRLLAKNFRLQGVPGNVVLDDFMQSSLRPEQFDLVYSLGLIEHFDDLESVVGLHMNYVKPRGVLFVVSPNLEGFYGRVIGLLAPALLSRHCVFGPEALRRAFELAGAKGVKTGYLGSFFFNLGTDSDWTYLSNWPGSLRRLLQRAVRVANASISLGFRISPWRPHSRRFSTGFYAWGRKREDASNQTPT